MSQRPRRPVVQPDWLRDYITVPERDLPLEGAEENEEAVEASSQPVAVEENEEAVEATSQPVAAEPLPAEPDAAPTPAANTEEGSSTELPNGTQLPNVHAVMYLLFYRSGSIIHVDILVVFIASVQTTIGDEDKKVQLFMPSFDI